VRTRWWPRLRQQRTRSLLIVETASMVDELVAEAGFTADEFVAEAASTEDEVVAEAWSTDVQVLAKATSTSAEIVAEAAPTADEVVAETVCSGATNLVCFKWQKFHEKTLRSNLLNLRPEPCQGFQMKRM